MQIQKYFQVVFTWYRSEFHPGIWVHPGSILSINICLPDTNKNIILEWIIPERVHLGQVVAPNLNFCSRMKPSQTFLKYHVKEVQAHSGMELGMWIGWADQLTHIFWSANAFTTLSFQNENFYENVECEYVALEWNSFLYHISTTL